MGQPMPDFIANAPELQLGLQIFLQAFFELDTERQIGPASVGGIAYSSIRDYANAHGFTEDETSDLCFMIRKLDTFYLSDIHGKKP